MHVPKDTKQQGKRKRVSAAADDGRPKRGRGKKAEPKGAENVPKPDDNTSKGTNTDCDKMSSAKLNADLEQLNSLNNDIFVQILRAKNGQKTRIDLAPLGCPQIIQSRNVLHYNFHTAMGLRCPLRLIRSTRAPLVEMLSQMQLFRVGSPFDRRCTAMEWHPTNPDLLAVGNKSGDVILWNTKHVKDDQFITGLGPGLGIQALKFLPTDHQKAITASIDGTVTLQDFEGRQKKVLLDTLNMAELWYCSLDVNPHLKLLASGRNTGHMDMLALDGTRIWEKQLHKKKITHIEFSTREQWLMCTSSVDHTVCIWDVRMIKDRKSTLQVLQHDKGINSACFSLKDGTRLLTTDQHHEIRVYRAPTFHLERTIVHPHRFFQHLTAIKAAWHPLEDLIVIGRYPDEKMPDFIKGEKRTIDMIDADSGKMVCQLHDSQAPGIVSLNKFNHAGDTLASCMGVSILVWDRQEEMMRKQDAVMDEMKQQGITPSTGTSSNRPPVTDPPKRKKKSKDTEEKKKKLLLAMTETKDKKNKKK